MLVTPIGEEGTTGSEAVTVKGFEVREQPGYGKDVNTSSTPVVPAEGLAASEPAELDLPSLIDNTTGQSIDFRRSPGSGKLETEGVSDDTRTADSKSDSGTTEDSARLPASKGSGSNSGSAEDNHAEDGVLVPALKKRHGVALSYMPVAVAADPAGSLPTLQNLRPVQQHASKGADTDVWLNVRRAFNSPGVIELRSECDPRGRDPGGQRDKVT